MGAYQVAAIYKRWGGANWTCHKPHETPLKSFHFPDMSSRSYDGATYQRQSYAFVPASTQCPSVKSESNYLNYTPGTSEYATYMSTPGIAVSVHLTTEYRLFNPCSNSNQPK